MGRCAGTVAHSRSKVLAICTGNICRSAMAGIVLHNKARELGVADALEIATAGVSSEEQGNPMDRRAVQVLRERSYDISDPLVKNHRARKTSSEEVAEADLILPMTESHAQALVSRFDADPAKVYMWRWFEGHDLNALRSDTLRSGAHNSSAQVSAATDARDGGAGAPHLAEDLADPWYGGHDDFVQALDELEASAEAIVQFAQSQVQT